MSKKLIIEELQNGPLTYDELSLKINDSNLAIELESLEEDRLIAYSKKTNTYKLSTKKKNIEVIEYDLSKDKIISILNEDSYPLSTIAYKCGAKKDNTKMLLEEMVANKEIYKAFNGYYEIYGVSYDVDIKINNNGDGIVFINDKKYYVRNALTLNIFTGDTVRVMRDMEFLDDNAFFIDVINHKYDYTIGVIKIKNKKTKNGIVKRYTFESTMKDMPISVPLNGDDVFNIPETALIKAFVKYYDTNISLSHFEIVGDINDPTIEITKIALEFGFNIEFNDEVLDEIKSIPDSVLENEYNGRRDFRDLNIITIDGDDSKDFDDAVYLSILDNGNYELQVHIADVSHYVKWEAPLDKEALKRGTSLYLADRVIPMLPHKLSNGICSLNEGVDRLVLSCIMEIDKKGNLINYEICEGVINSHHRMTYNKVNKILNGDKELIEEYNDIYDMLLKMKELSNIIRNIRTKKGGIEFDTVEYSFKLDEIGKPIEIIRRDRADSEKLIEDFMLKANETVAYHMNIMGLPIIYRIHEKPDQEKLHATFGEIRGMGVEIKNIQNDIHPKEIQDVLNKITDNPNKDIISNMLLRSMMKAKYSNDNLGHYGLALNYYCHFTSPIRRYPDLMTHRMIKKLFIHPGSNFEKELKYYNSIMLEIAMKNSSSERRSVDCERSVDDMLYAWYMEDKVNNEYEGIITSITSFGMFIEIGMGIEGLFLYRDANRYYYVDEKTNTCESQNNVYHVGDKVQIIVSSADRENRCIYFNLKDDYNDRSRRYYHEDYMSK